MSAQQRSAFLNYITDEHFRKSLESDYREIQAALASKSWKTVHVLAGSLIETILIDYLLTKAYSDAEKDRVLRLELGPAMEECRKDGVLSDENANLCTVLRHYRNLIHPGRVKRLEKTPTENAAEVAARVVLMVAADIAKKRKETYGYTAEQVMEKLMTDPDGFPGVLDSLLAKVNESEKERLLFDSLPAQNQSLRRDIESGLQDWEVAEAKRQLQCVKICFRAIVKGCYNPDTKRRLISDYVKTLESSSSDARRFYETAFLHEFHFANAYGSDQEIIKKHLFSLMGKGASEELLENTTSLGGWIEEADFPRLIDIYIAHCKKDFRFGIWTWIDGCYTEMGLEKTQKFKKHIELSIEHEVFSGRKMELLRSLLAGGEEIPF